MATYNYTGELTASGRVPAIVRITHRHDSEGYCPRCDLHRCSMLPDNHPLLTTTPGVER